MDTILATAPQLTKPDRWKALVRYIIDKIVAVRIKHGFDAAVVLPGTQLAEFAVSAHAVELEQPVLEAGCYFAAI